MSNIFVVFFRTPEGVALSSSTSKFPTEIFWELLRIKRQSPSSTSPSSIFHVFRFSYCISTSVQVAIFPFTFWIKQPLALRRHYGLSGAYKKGEVDEKLSKRTWNLKDSPGPEVNKLKAFALGSSTLLLCLCVFVLASWEEESKLNVWKNGTKRGFVCWCKAKRKTREWINKSGLHLCNKEKLS